MAILDDAVKQGKPTGMEGILDRAARSLERVQARTNVPVVGAQTTQRVVAEGNINNSAQYNTEFYSAEDERKAEEASYLESQRKSYEKRQQDQQDENLWTSDANLYSDNLAVNLGANALNLGKRVAGGVGQMATGFMTYGGEAARDWIAKDIPEDVRNTFMRIQNRASLETNKKELASLQNQYSTGNLDRSARKALAERISDLEAVVDNSTVSRDEYSRFINAKDEQGNSYESRLLDMARAESVTKRIKGDPSKGIPSMLGAEQWGNRIAEDNARMLVDSDAIAKSVDEAEDLWDKGNYGAATAQGLKSFGTQLSEWGSSMVKNPASILGMAADSAVYMNPITAVPAALGLAGGTYAEGAQQYRDKQQQELGGVDQAKVGAIAAAMGGLGYAQGKIEGSALAGKFGGAIDNTARGLVGGVAKGTSAVSGATLGKVPYAGGILDMAVRGTGAVAREAAPIATRVGAATLAEGTAEAAQSVLEQNAGLQGTFDLEQTGESFAMGGVLGGALAAPGAAGATVVNAFGERGAENNLNNYGSPEATVEDLLNPDSEHFSPRQVINRGATEVLNKDTTPERKAEIHEEVEKAYASASDTYNATQSRIDNANNLEALKADMPEWEKRMDERRAAFDPARLDVFDKVREQQRQIRLAEIQKAEEDAADMEGLMTLHQETQTELESAQESYTAYQSWYKDQASEPEAAEATTDASTNTVKAEEAPATPTEAAEPPMQEANEDAGFPGFTRTANANAQTYADVQSSLDAVISVVAQEDGSIAPITAEGIKVAFDTDDATAAQVVASYLAEGLIDGQGNFIEPKEVSTESVSPSTQEAATLLGAPNYGEVKRMQELANDASLPEITRTQLRVVSEALIAENKKKSSTDVSNEILKGVPGYKGVSQYITTMGQAIATGNVAAQKAIVSQLGNFSAGISSKAAALREAHEWLTSEKTNPNGSVPLLRVMRRDKSNDWIVDYDGSKKKEFDKNNGAIVHKPTGKNPNGSLRLIEAVEDNAIAIQKAVEAVALMQQGKPDSVKTDPFDAAMDAFNANERATGRDTSARDNDPKAATVTPVVEPTTQTENNEGDLRDNSTETNFDPFDIEMDNEFDPMDGFGFDEAPKAQEDSSDNNAGNKASNITTKNEAESESVAEPTQSTNAEPEAAKTSKEITSEESKTEVTFEDDAMTKAEAEKLAKQMSKKTGKPYEAKAVVGGYDVVESQEKPKATPKPKVETKPESEGEAAKREPKRKNSEVPVENLKKVAEEATYDDTAEEADTTNVNGKLLQDGKVDSSPEGALSVLATGDQSYKEAIAEEKTKGHPNLVKLGFVQRVKAGINSPLVTIQNLRGKLRAAARVRGMDKVIVGLLHSQGVNASPDNIKRMKDFLEFTEAFKGYLLDQMAPKKNPQYYSDGMIDFLMVDGPNGTRTFDDNLVTAMSLSAYEWLGMNGIMGTDSKDQVAAKVFVTNAEVVPNIVHTVLGNVGTYNNEVMKELGQNVMQALQLKSLSDQDMELRSKVTMALGAFTLQALHTADLVQVTDVKLEVINELKLITMEANGEQSRADMIDPAGNVNTNQAVTFVRPSLQLDENGEPELGKFGYLTIPVIYGITAIKKEAPSLLTRVFGHTPALEQPSSEPIKTTPNTVDQTGTNLSEFQKEVMLKQQSEAAYTINSRMMDGFDKLLNMAIDGFDEMLGYKDPNKVLTRHRDSIISRNDQITRALDILRGTFADFADTGMFLPLSVWSNLRSGITSGFNPQADKVHRAFSALESDVVKVTGSVLTIGEGENRKFGQYGNFLRGLGYRLEDAKNLTGVDGELAKEDKFKFVSQLDTYINSEPVREAAQAYNKVLDGTATKEDASKVIDLLSSWGIESLGLSVIDALARREEALAKGQTSFETYVYAESDGSNNGPAITNTMMNTGTHEIMNSVGIFTRDDGITNLVQYRAQGGKDMYVQLAARKEQLMNDKMAEINQASEKLSSIHDKEQENDLPADYVKGLNTLVDGAVIYEAINRIDPNFNTRKGAKRDLVPFNYGAGMKSIVRASSREFLQEIYTKVEEAIVAENAPLLQTTINNVNAIIKQSNRIHGSNVALLADADVMMSLDFQLTDSQEKLIRSIEEAYRGPIITDALTGMLGDYIDARNKFSSISEGAFGLFDVMYQQELALETEAYYKENPEARKNNEGLPKTKHDKLLNRMRKYMPKVNVPMGLESNQFGNVAIPLMGTEKNWSEKALRVPYHRPARSRLKINSIESDAKWTQEKDSSANGSSTSAAIENTSLSSPGVGAIAKFIQSIDAYVAFRTMQAFNVQNYHDANPINAAELERMAKGQNEFFLDGVTIAHIGESFLNAFLDPLSAYGEGLVDISADNLKNVSKNVRSVFYKFGFDEAVPLKKGLIDMIDILIQADVQKLDNFIHNVNAINQYATQGGEYIITPEKRKVLMDRREALLKRAAKMRERAAVIADSFEQRSKADFGKVRGLSMREIRNLENEQGERKLTPTEAALLNQRNELSDPHAFVKFLDKQIAQHIHDESNVGKFAKVYRHLLRATMSSLSGLEVNIFTDAENTSHINGYETAIKEGTSAWYINKDGKRQINVRVGTQDKINSTVLLHELLHAATADALAQVRANPEAYPQAKRAYDGLNEILEQVQAAVQKQYPDHEGQQSKEEYLIKYATKSVDELLATGLTDVTVMRFLDKVVIRNNESRNLKALKKNTVIGKIAQSVITIMRDVFGKKEIFNSTAATAYEALVMDVAEFIKGTTNINRSDDVQVDILGAPKGTGLDDVQNMSAADTYKTLKGDGLDPTFDKALGTTVMGMADRILSNLPKDYKGTGRFSPENIWNHALETGEAPYISPAVAAGFTMTDKEQFATEILELVIGDTSKDSQLSQAMSELTRMFDMAREKIKVEDLATVEWAKASAEQKAEAQAKYDYLFDTRKKDYLVRFGALALGNAEINKLLDFNASYKNNNKRNKEGFARVYNYFDRAADMVVNNHLGVQDMRGNKRIEGIVRKLIDVSNKNKNKVLEVIEGKMAEVDSVLNEGIQKAAGKVTDLALATKPVTTAGKLTRNTVAATLGGNPMKIFEVTAMMRDQTFKNKTLGFVGELGKEIGDVTKEGRVIEGLLRIQKTHETNAQRLRTEIKKDLLSMFVDKLGKPLQLSKAVREAITATFLRSDIQSLTSTYSSAEIKGLVSNPHTIKAEISKLTKGVPAMQVVRAKMLGWYMVSGIGHNLLGKNAYAIASNAGLGLRGSNPTEAQVQRIDQLASLYALNYTSNDKLKAVAEMYEGNTEALENVIKYHKGLVQDSKDYLFNGSEMNMTKGYMPEVTNHHKSIEIARSPADADRLRSAMYKEIGPVNRDPQDNAGFTPIMFYTEDSTKQGYVSGAMALYNYGAKGTQVDMDPRDLADFQNSVRGQSFDADWDPRTETSGSVIPKYDENGNVTGYRYEMSAHKRDTLLERNNDFSDLLGTFTSLGYTKMANQDHNMDVVDALYDKYKEAKTLDRNRYVYVSYESTDPVAYAAWNRLSNETKQYVKEKWGSYGMWVPNDVFLTVFGAPKRSLLTESFDKDPSVHNVVEKIYTELMKSVFRGNARVVAAKTERVWQEVVAVSKNFVVIRNLSTLLMNLASNTFLLMAHGVPVGDLIKNTRDSIKGGMQYRKDIALLTRLEARLRSGVGNEASTQSQINQLRNRIEANPLNEFIEVGMFSGIVEDVDPSQDMYSYQSAVQRKYDKYYNKVPYALRRTAEYAFVTPSTPIYQFLHSATQYSDFSAKYVLYKHLTETAKEKMSKEEALQEASDNFINYDVPTSPWLQYANDMGLVMFTKYNLRIQKALFRLIGKRPASAIGQAIMMQSVTALPPGIDPIVFNQYGNPFRDGAFSIFGTVDEPFPIKALF